MNAVPRAAAVPLKAHRAATVIEHPLFTVVESAAPADSVAMHDALDLLVKWAVRQHARCSAPAQEPADAAEFTAVGAGEQA